MKFKRSFMGKILPLLFVFTIVENQFAFSCHSKNCIEFRKIAPPKLDDRHLGKEILCHRPMRRGSPNMSVEKIGNQIVAHNYGHGGSGWTLAPGSAKYVNDILIKSEYSTSLKKDTKITIIGGGVLGLFTAYDLKQRHFTDVTIVAESFENLTSHNAGGLVAPVSMSNSEEVQKIIDKMGIDAYKFYRDVSNGKNKYIKSGAVVVPSYFENREESGLEPYVGKVMKPAKDVIIDVGNNALHKMVVYDDGIFVDTSKLMEELSTYLQNEGVKFVRKKINSFSDVKGKFVIDCSGIGGSGLNNDTELVSVQGHLVMLKDQIPADLQYMILIYFDKNKDVKTKSGQKIKRSFYIFPKHLSNTGVNDVGVLGGTFIEGATAETPNDEEFDIIIAQARRFYGIQ